MIFLQTIIRVRASTSRDAHGNDVRSWDHADELVIESVSVQPATQTEDDGATRTSTVTGWAVQSAPGVDLDVRASDRVRFDGVTYTVEGEVARWPDPLTGAVHHVEFTIERQEG